MKSEKNLRIAFFGILVALITYIQSPLVTYTLDAFVGEAGSQELTRRLRENTSELVLALLVAFYFDVIRRRFEDREKASVHAAEEEAREKDVQSYVAQNERVIQEIRAEVERIAELHDTDLLKRSNPREVIRSALSLAFPSDAEHLDSLVDNIVGGESWVPILNVDVNHRLVPKGDDKFTVQRWQTRSMSGSAEASKYVLAITGTKDTTEWATYGCPLVIDCFDVGSPNLLAENVQAHLKSAYVEVVPSDDPHRRAVRRTLERIPPAKWPDLVGGSIEQFTDEMALLSADIPATSDPVMVYNEFTLDRALANFVYWQADCPSLVGEISFDISSVVGVLSDREFTVIPFSGYAADVPTLSGDGKFSVRPRNWLVKGQGAVLTWQPKSFS